MRRIPVPRTLTSLSLTAFLAVHSFAQNKTATELDVARCWSVPLDAAVSHLATDGVRIFPVFDSGGFKAFSLDGKAIWSAEFGGEIVSNVLIGERSIYLTTNAGGENGNSVLRLLSRDTGIVGSIISLPTADRHFISNIGGSIVVVSASGVVQVVDDKGLVKWRREIAAGFSGSPAFGRERVYVASTAQQVFTIHLATGEIESVRKMSFNVTAIGAASNGGLLVGDERGNLTSLSPDGRTNWRFRSGGRISRIEAANGQIIALSHDNFVYLLDASNGGVVWKRRMGGRAAYSAIINSGYALTTSLDEHGAVLTALHNGKPAGQVVLAGDEFVSADPVAIGPLVFIGTNSAIYAYSLVGASGCPK